MLMTGLQNTEDLGSSHQVLQWHPPTVTSQNPGTPVCKPGLGFHSLCVSKQSQCFFPACHTIECGSCDSDSIWSQKFERRGTFFDSLDGRSSPKRQKQLCQKNSLNTSWCRVTGVVRRMGRQACIMPAPFFDPISCF